MANGSAPTAIHGLLLPNLVFVKSLNLPFNLNLNFNLNFGCEKMSNFFLCTYLLGDHIFHPRHEKEVIKWKLQLGPLTPPHIKMV